MTAQSEVHDLRYLRPTFSGRLNLSSEADIDTTYSSESARIAETLNVDLTVVLRGMLGITELSRIFGNWEINIPDIDKKALFTHYLSEYVLDGHQNRISSLAVALGENIEDLESVIDETRQAPLSNFRQTRDRYIEIMFGLEAPFAAEKESLYQAFQTRVDLGGGVEDLHEQASSEFGFEIVRSHFTLHLLFQASLDTIAAGLVSLGKTKDERTQIARDIGVDEIENSDGNLVRLGNFGRRVQELYQSGTRRAEISAALGSSVQIVDYVISYLLGRGDIGHVGKYSKHSREYYPSQFCHLVDEILALRQSGRTIEGISESLNLRASLVKTILTALIADGYILSKILGHQQLAPDKRAELELEILALRQLGLDDSTIAKKLIIRDWRIRDVVTNALLAGRIESVKGRRGASRRIYPQLKNADPDDMKAITKALSQADYTFCANNSGQGDAILSSFGRLVSDLGYMYRSDPGLFVEVVRSRGVPIREVKVPTKKRKKDQTVRYNFKGHDDRIRDIIQTDPRLQGLKRKK